MRKLVVAIVALTLAGGIAACGGDEEEDFATQANAICTEGAEVAREINLELGLESATEDVIEFNERLLEARQAGLTDLEALEPPADLSDAYDEYLAAREDLVSATEENIAALEDDDTAAIEAADAAVEEAVGAMESAGAELDLDACAGVLPDDDAQAAEDVLREYSTTVDPEVICGPDGISTEAFLENILGGEENCLEGQEEIVSDPDQLPEDIEVTDVSGVDDIAATIEYEEVGGGADGTAFTAQLFYIDGEWKIFTVFGASPS